MQNGIKTGIDMIDVTGMKWKKNRENKMVYFDIGKTLANILKIPVMITGGGKGKLFTLRVPGSGRPRTSGRPEN